MIYSHSSIELAKIDIGNDSSKKRESSIPINMIASFMTQFEIFVM